MLRKKAQDNPFNDGIVNICRVENVSAPGDMPRSEEKVKHVLRYQERTVGIFRDYLAKQNQQRIDLVIRCPFLEDVSVLDVAVIPRYDRNLRYLIRQKQKPPDIVPSVMDLALEKEGGENETD